MAFIITEKYLKERVNISKQKDAEDLKVVMESVTEFHIKDLLSIPLYEVLLANIGLTPHQAALLEKTKLYFALMVHYDLLLDVVEITNRGSQVDANTPEVELLKLKRTEVFTKAEKMKARILKYLSDNSAEFTNYFPNKKEVGSLENFPIVFLDEPKKWFGSTR